MERYNLEAKVLQKSQLEYAGVLKINGVVFSYNSVFERRVNPKEFREIPNHLTVSCPDGTSASSDEPAQYEAVPGLDIIAAIARMLDYHFATFSPMIEIAKKTGLPSIRMGLQITDRALGLSTMAKMADEGIGIIISSEVGMDALNDNGRSDLDRLLSKYFTPNA
jgi:hypothetical protein